MTGLTELLQGVIDKPVQAPGDIPYTNFSTQFIAESIAILDQLDAGEIEHMALGLAQVRSSGRLFIRT